MLDGVQMNVVAMSKIIRFVADSVLKITRLPDPAAPLTTMLIGHLPVGWIATSRLDFFQKSPTPPSVIPAKAGIQSRPSEPRANEFAHATRAAGFSLRGLYANECKSQRPSFRRKPESTHIQVRRQVR
jgi:hypothetical protein